MIWTIVIGAYTHYFALSRLSAFLFLDIRVAIVFIRFVARRALCTIAHKTSEEL